MGTRGKTDPDDFVGKRGKVIRKLGGEGGERDGVSTESVSPHGHGQDFLEGESVFTNNAVRKETLAREEARPGSK